MGVSKAALESASRYLARYLGPEGVRCNLVAAGPLETIAKKAIPGSEEFNNIWGTRAPLGWDSKDLTPTAKAVVALLSDWFPSVSYTHLDVYKRQAQHRVEAVVLDRQPTPHVRYDGGDPGVGLGRQAGRSLGDVQGDPDSRIVVAQRSQQVIGGARADFEHPGTPGERSPDRGGDRVEQPGRQDPGASGEHGCGVGIGRFGATEKIHISLPGHVPGMPISADHGARSESDSGSAARAGEEVEGAAQAHG